jgi:hypothetical protein
MRCGDARQGKVTGGKVNGDCWEVGDASNEGIQMEVSRGKGPKERCSTAIKTVTRREEAGSGLYFTLIL